MKKQKSFLIFLGTLIPVVFVNFLVLVFAWTGPTDVPPGGNVPTFLNVSDSTQFKEGALGVGGVFEALGIRLSPGESSQPTCSSETRGMFWLEKGGTEENDDLLFCRKNSNDDYVWKIVAWQ